MRELPAWLVVLDRNAVVANALSAVVDRRNPDGRAWCPPSVGRRLIALVAQRGEQLASAVHGAVLVAHLLRLADGRHHWAPLYRSNTEAPRVAELTAPAFRRLVERAGNGGRPGQETISVSGDRVSFEAGRPGGKGRAVSLAFASMPLFAGLLAVLHEALGLAEIDRLVFQPTGERSTGGDAHAAASAVARGFDGWLTQNLATAHQMRQARIMRAFLARVDRYDPTEIDDEVLLRFWEEQAGGQQSARGDDFKRYTTAVRKLLHYRQDMFQHAAARGLETAHALDAADGAEARSVIAGTDTGPWQSPLAALAEEPASEIKWLTGRERQRLVHYLGSQSGANSREGDEGGDGLAGGHRLEERFWLTLLRADVFGAAQARLTQALRDGAEARDAIGQCGREMPPDGYAGAAESYRELREHIEQAMLAALDVLWRHRPGATAGLIAHFADEQIIAELRRSAQSADGDAGDAEEQGARRLQAIRGDLERNGGESLPGLARLLATARAARKRLRRRGLEGDREAERAAAYVASAAPLVQLAEDLDRLLGRLDRQAATAEIEADRRRFLAAFTSLYAADGDAGADDDGDGKRRPTPTY